MFGGNMATNDFNNRKVRIPTEEELTPYIEDIEEWRKLHENTPGTRARTVSNTELSLNHREWYGVDMAKKDSDLTKYALGRFDESGELKQEVLTLDDLKTVFTWRSTMSREDYEQALKNLNHCLGCKNWRGRG